MVQGAQASINQGQRKLFPANVLLLNHNLKVIPKAELADHLDASEHEQFTWGIITLYKAYYERLANG